MRIAGRLFLMVVALAACVAPSLAATPVAVFNFQMKSDTPDWKWLEKGLADRITTDFTQDRGLAVVARDEMQVLAQKMNWAPEMATTDAKGMGQVKTQLKVETLVTGVYEVAGGEIRITGQIVEVGSRKEVARKEIAGKAEDVLELQRRLSAELLSVVVNKPAAEILTQLPVWTRSLPAAKALYEGMDLYDQGRYAEGWLKFRQASKADPQYMEAQYFVGKMYYFLDRYEHARRALEKFVYLDTTHPRVGDAMVEYVHTYENSATAAESLLQLYDDLRGRFADASVWAGRGKGTHGFLKGFLEGADWLTFKKVQVLDQLGRHKEAALITRPAMSTVGGYFSSLYCILNVIAHHALTGETFEPDVLVNTQWERDRRQVLRFDERGSALEWRFPSPTRISGSTRGASSKEAVFERNRAQTVLLLVAPSGYVFRSLTFHPVADGKDISLGVALYVPGVVASEGYQFAPERSEALEAARQRGVVWDKVPPSGFIKARCVFRAKEELSQSVNVHGVRVIARLEAIPSPGAVDVVCADSPCFGVEVDGMFARWLPGIVGPLAPGEHLLRLIPLEPGAPYGPWEGRATVESGKVTRLSGRLPWKGGSPWCSWKTLCIGRDYAGYDVGLCNGVCPPAIQADEGAIRLVWTYRGDLWSSVSTDGENFSAPARIVLPVSTGWYEGRPRLLRDESGRFILTFLSDRESRHRQAPYVCWSRDFIHWSAPALVSDETVYDYDLLQDNRGRFLWAHVADRAIRILSSGDGLQWQPLCSVEVAPKGWYCDMPNLIQREDGRFELFVSEYALDASIPELEKREIGARVLCYISSDGVSWSRPETIDQCRWDAHPTALACGRAPGQSYVLWSRSGPNDLYSRLALYTRKSEREWQQFAFIPSMPPGAHVSTAFHSAWGFLVASMMSQGAQGIPHPSFGPYLLRGPTLDPLKNGKHEVAAAQVSPPPPSEQQIGRGEIRDSSGKVLSTSLRNKAVEEWFRAFQPRPAPSTGAGDLSSLPYVWCIPHRIPGGSMYFEVRDRAAFNTPAQNSGTINQKAVMLKLERDALRMAVALDSKTPENPTYDVLRLDATGQGNFENAVEVPWLFMGHAPPPNQSFGYTSFVHPCVGLKDGNRIVQAAMKAQFEERRGQQTFEMNLFTCSLGKCAFGAKVHDILLIDTDGNLRINNAFRIASLEGRKHVFGSGDTVVVDPPKTKPVRPLEGTSDERRVTWGYYGHPLLVDGTLYEVTVSEDGARISAKPFQGKTGLIRIDHPLWEAEIANEGRVIVLRGGTAAVPVPIGRYRVLRYWEWSPDGGQWANVQPLCLWRPKSSVGKEFWIEVREGQTLEVPAGSPLRGQLVVEQDGRTLHFRVRIADTGGWQAVDTQDFHQECSIIIRDASGQPVKTLRSALIPLIHSREEWSVPPELRGTFSASVEVGPGRFPVTVEKSQFSVK